MNSQFFQFINSSVTPANYLILQFLVAALATISFAILFNAPKKELLFCGISGAIGWCIYVFLLGTTESAVLANMVGTLALAIYARIMAALRKKTATIYLVAGIFPLVPGAGIYYTSYYLIMNDNSMMGYYAKATLGAAGAIVLGISLAMLIPQSFFNRLANHSKSAH